MFKPRPNQQEVIQYTSGMMGISAVPGSGKTQTLSYLASQLIVENHVKDDQEVLIVTLVNAAVDNFAGRIKGFLSARKLLPDFGYRVRTLHGLAHDIVRERPDLAGLSDRFDILDENETGEILRTITQAWLHTHPDLVVDYTSPDVDLEKANFYWQRGAVDLASAIIRMAKDKQMTAQDIEARIRRMNTRFPLMEFGIDIYKEYQRSLNTRAAVDFDDLIRLALKSIETDTDYLERLRYRWQYILEDEAQDSSRLQEMILRKLAGPEGNWVRVGDPNQAIYETFTTASPTYLLDFLKEPGVMARELPQSGRSTISIMRLANLLISWTRSEHPDPELRSALVLPYITPTGVDDPQPNPPDQPKEIHLYTPRQTAGEEISLVVRSLIQWLPAHPDATVAVLVPRNERGTKLVEELRKVNLPFHEILNSSVSTRQTAGILSKILRYLAEPSTSSKLVDVYKALHPVNQGQDELGKRVIAIGNIIRHCLHLEEYLAALPGHDWLETLEGKSIDPSILSEIAELRTLVQRWQAATILPIDQLVLTISQDLFNQSADLALGHKLALALEREAQQHPNWRLPEFSERLDTIARNERKFLGMSDEDTAFTPENYKGKVVVATIHKAKGLEWDRVYLLSVNNYDFPACQPQDEFIGEKWFVRNKLNLQEEAISQLEALTENQVDITSLYLEEGVATSTARLDYARERLRLLYVGITRAKKELIITWNTGRPNHEAQPALALLELARRYPQA
jgi:DNA helicase-2/ATP-dependent DNA helicase PcrA